MSLRDFLFLEKVGEGAYSTVWKVKRHSDQGTYALKKVRMAKLSDKERRNALNEVKFLSSINNPCVVTYKDAFFDDDSGSLCLVMEFAESGDLYQKIQQCLKNGHYMSESFLWKVLISVTQGLKALHDLNIMHRDLKSANVFLMNNSQVKLGDMNVSKVAQEGMMHTQTGTPYYASPEVWKDIPYDTKSDIWSLGCVLYEAASLKPPFQAEDMQSLYRKVTRGEYPGLPSAFSDEFRSVIAVMIQVDPRNRPSCDQLLHMPVVAKHNPESRTRYGRLRPGESSPSPKKLLLPSDEGLSDRKSSYRERLNAQQYRSLPREAAGMRRDHSSSKNNLSLLQPRPREGYDSVMREDLGALRLPKLRQPGRLPDLGLNPSRARLAHVGKRGLVPPAWWG